MPYQYLKNKQQLGEALNHIREAVYTPLADLETTAWITPEPVPYAERETGEKKQLSIGKPWGKLWDCGWFNFKGTVPAAAKGHKVILLLDVSGEGCVVDDEGKPVLGLTTKASTYDFSLGNPGKRVVPVTDCAEGGETIDLWVETGANDLFGNVVNNGILEKAQIAIQHDSIYAYYHDFAVLYDLMQQLPEKRARANKILAALNASLNQIHTFAPEEAEQAQACLADELAKVNGTPSLKISAIGHAHMDLAWLWPIRETIRKTGRTWATVLRNMERYPDYVFGCSQPQLYQWMKDTYPDLYKQVAARIAEGRWEAQGAAWVEPDSNVASGEAWIRQILYGKRFFKDEFGIEPRTLWIPDVFGYSGSLPQILKKSGVDYFVTQKLSWNNHNTFPHHTFHWQGIDGSKVLTHMLPENTYNSSAEPHALMDAETNYADKVVSDECLLVYGIGDGGGGPGESHLEALKRESDLEGLPPVTQERSQDFLDRLAQNADLYATWVGELYLERHQGTFTSQGRNKWYNRKIEYALREFELWAALTGVSFDKQSLDRIWQAVLLYQFHDILPGSSITRVYDESLAHYAELLAQVEGFIETAQARLSTGNNDGTMVTNSLSWQRSEWVKIGEQWVFVTVPSMGFTTVDMDAAPALPNLTATTASLENDKLTVQFDDTGAVISVFDKGANREVLTDPGNILNVYTDFGDAWDIEPGYRERRAETFSLIESRAFVDGPRAVIEQTYLYGKSTLKQDIVLTAGSSRLDFVTRIDWQERHKMLRTSFPVDVHSDTATCDIQFGSVSRPTHDNTSWDMAKDEICAHKWVDISQRDYGVALLNDSKYGYTVKGHILDLNLMRSASYPDPVADKGQHQFTYALLPHEGGHVSGAVNREGYELNVPLRVLPGSPAETTTSTASFLAIDADNVIIETVKPAEDGQGIIVRMVEVSGAATDAKLQAALPYASAVYTDLMEQHLEQVATNDGRLRLHFNPFEIITVRLIPA